MSMPTDGPQVSVWIFSGIAQAQDVATLAQCPIYVYYHMSKFKF